MRPGGRAPTPHLARLYWPALASLSPNYLFNPFVGEPGSLPPQPLSEGIDGPTMVNGAFPGTWTADISGGSPPYSYQWSGVLSGTGSSISGMVYSSDYLYLDVWDSVGSHIALNTYLQYCGDQISC